MKEKGKFFKYVAFVGLALVLVCMLQNALCSKDLKVRRLNAAKRGVSCLVLKRIGQLSEEHWNQHGTFPFSLYELVRNATNLPPHLLQGDLSASLDGWINQRLEFVKRSNYWIEKLDENRILVSEKRGLRSDNRTLFCIFTRTPEGQTSSLRCWEKMTQKDSDKGED